MTILRELSHYFKMLNFLPDKDKKQIEKIINKEALKLNVR